MRRLHSVRSEPRTAARRMTVIVGLENGVNQVLGRLTIQAELVTGT